ncbi:uncharacterized protein PRCAT00000529001 [Priceomyces carsonii]|uniref:uncharacterized protein n=1 Tax=Priceomyces carsonii TaxID=28549 RepID=UPI002EDB330E|nr:unnamed protein product [Priceomyces carsonii]
MARLQAARKQVSFQQVNEEETVAPSSPSNDFPRAKRLVQTIPIHYLFVLLGMFKLGLTQEIPATLFRGYFSLLALQIVYGYVLNKNIAGKATKKHKKEDDNIILLVFASLLISTILSIPVFIALVLFGAPLSSHLQETYLLALHLSNLVFYPTLVIFKLDYEVFVKMLSLESLFKVILSSPTLCSSALCLVGTWLAVIPIPLDWDRPWQQWPITLISGAYFGSFVGGTISLLF